MDALITSRANPKVKQLRLLRERKHREAAGLFLVEGIRPVGEAVEAGAPLEAIYYAPDLLQSEYAQDLVRRQAALGLSSYALSGEVFESVAGRENPQGILAVVRARQADLVDLHPQNFPWGVALVSPQDPGNVGTILRTVDAVGASGLLLLDSSVDPFHPSAVRASMGALFWHPLASATFPEFVRWAGRHSYHIYGTSAHASLDYRQMPEFEQPMVLLLGSERQGLTEEQSAACHALLRLPMRGRATSLNLAVAAGVMLYEMLSRIKQ